MPLPTDLHAGADVYSSDGHKLGELHRVVLKRSDLSVTHIVVDIGFLRSGRPIWEGGVGLDYDRVVPIAGVANANDERIDLGMTAAQFKDAPEYTVEHFEAPRDLSPGEFDIPDMVGSAQKIADYIGSVGAGYWLYEKLNKPSGSVDIAEGTPVWRQHPHEKLGDVHHVLFGPDGVAQALVIERGLLFKRDVILPVRYVSEWLDDLVRVDITDEHLDALQEYKG